MAEILIKSKRDLENTRFDVSCPKCQKVYRISLADAVYAANNNTDGLIIYCDCAGDGTNQSITLSNILCDLP